MDYTKQNLSFKIKKTIRYLKLYGLSRTLIKVKGQYHMNKLYDKNNLPKFKNPKKGRHVGILGSGNYAFGVIAFYLKRKYGNVIKSTMDINLNRAISLAENFKAYNYSDTISEIINNSDIDLIYIASNHYTHAEYAIEALKNNKSVHIEKPHVVNRDQLNRLVETLKTTEGKVRLGFNRPASKFGKIILDQLTKEEGSTMINWFIAGHEINPNHWYFQEKEGGRILGNLCHWTDFTYQMIEEKNRYPIKIIPTRSEKADCDISVSYVFGDGSIACITFSAKGHTFEGVREKLNVHKGNTLITMNDYESLRVDVIDKKNTYKNLFRDHGHKHNIERSYEMISKNLPGESIKYLYESADLFLKTKEALESNKITIVEKYNNK